jgi:hypothetical protein
MVKERMREGPRRDQTRWLDWWSTRSHIHTVKDGQMILVQEEQGSHTAENQGEGAGHLSGCASGRACGSSLGSSSGGRR